MRPNLNINNKLLEAAQQLLTKGRYILAAEKAAEVCNTCSLEKLDNRKALWLQLHAYNRMQWLVEACDVAEKIKKESSLDKDTLLELALLQVLLGKNQTARKYFKLAIKKFGNDALFLSELAITYEQQGDVAQAIDIFDKITSNAIKKSKINEVVIRVFGRLAGLRILKNEERLFLEKNFKKLEQTELSTRIAYTLAKNCRKDQDIKQEIKWLTTANSRAKFEEEKAGSVWLKEQAVNRTELIKTVFPSQALSWINPIEDNTEQFVFILGMPRSGTTLVEQIIGAHSQVGNSGESRALDVALFKARRSLGLNIQGGEFNHLKNISKLSNTQLVELAENYKTYQRLLTNKNIVTDKALSNIDWLGLLANLFPKAKFLYVERDPLDNCVSLMQQDFKNAPYSNTAEHCVLEYKEYSRKVDHWQTLYGNRLSRVKYEELVSNPKKEMRVLFKALGLEWEDGIDEFYKRSNSVRTPSVGQVRQSISTAQVGKWKPYESLIRSAIGLV